MLFGLIFYFMKYRALQKRFITVEKYQEGDELDDMNTFYHGDMQAGNVWLQLNWDDYSMAFDKKSPYDFHWPAAQANFHVWSSHVVFT